MLDLLPQEFFKAGVNPIINGKEYKITPDDLVIDNNFDNSIFKPKELLLGDISFELKSYPNLKPENISYEDYKNLTYDALKTIFGNDKEKLSYASSLMTQSQRFDDDILNKVYFDKKIENNDEYHTMYDQTLQVIAMMNRDIVSIDENGIQIKDPYGNRYTTPSDKTFTTKNKLFSDFNQSEKWYNSNSNIKWTGFYNIPKIIDTMKEIKAEYEKRVSENNSILNQYTKNSKPNPVESL